MGFPKTVKDEMLVASARHCCVCHRYKGVKVEVHHIVQESKGGPNTFENAIALCFDCHADAGHYNLAHPKGTKFSPEELIKAKNTWIKMVRENNIKPPGVPDYLLCRYYVCKNFEILTEISEFDFSNFPAQNVMLQKNNIFLALKDIIRRHPGRYRHGTVSGRSFESEKEYLKYYRHPEDLVDEKGRFPYYCGERKPTQEDLETLSKIDGVANAMLEYGASAEKAVSVVGCYEDACHGIKLFEDYLLRELWCVFLAIENLSPNPVTLEYIEGELDSRDGFGELGAASDAMRLDLPASPIVTGQTVIVPLAVLLSPLGPFEIEHHSSEFPHGTGEYYLSISHCSLDAKQTNRFLTYKGVINPKSIRISNSDGQFSQSIHELDLNNFYEIDMAWGAGSCPHLFYRTNRLIYVRELIASCENVFGNDEFVIPDGITKAIIVELEDEISEIEHIKLNGRRLASKLILEKGQSFEFDVTPGDHVELVGKYVPLVQSRHDIPAGRFRNSIVHEYLLQNS